MSLQSDKSSQPQDTPRVVECPFCGSNDTELLGLFGSFLLTSQYYCPDCRTVFDRVRWDDDTSPTP